MMAYIHPHKPTKHRPTQQWAAYDANGTPLGYAHVLDKLEAWLREQGYTIQYEQYTHNR